MQMISFGTGGWRAIIADGFTKLNVQRLARALALRRCAIAIGSEGRGLTEQVLGLCDRTVRIPMAAHCESLNAAVAAAVLLWEAYR